MMFRLTALAIAAVVAGAGFGISAGQRQPPPPPPPVPPPAITARGARVEQTAPGTKPSAELMDSFDGLGVGFEGPQGTFTGRSPSDSSLAAGPDHVVQIVNSRLAIYTKKGARYDTTGRVLYGPVATNQMFAGLGGVCEGRNNGDAVVRYDQLANRWLIVMPIFGRIPPGQFHVPGERPAPEPAAPGQLATKGQAATPGPAAAPPPDPVQPAPPLGRGQRGQPPAPGQPTAAVPPAPPPAGTYAMCYAVSTTPDPLGTYYLCNGQLSNCVPQPGTDRRLDAQGDKIMQRLVYRRVNGHESIVASHSVATKAGGGGVRWYEFRLDKKRTPVLYQQATYAPDGFFRWMASVGMDKHGNIGIGYSFGGTPNFAGQRFAARMANDPKGQLTLRETVLVEGQGAQTNTLRWEDYATVAMDPGDDCTFWYAGDYFKKDAISYSSRIGSFRLPGCR